MVEYPGKDFRRETPATNPTYDRAQFVQQCS